MRNEVTVGIIGAGKVAWHLVKGLEKAGVQVRVVYSRTLAHAQELAAQTSSAVSTDSLDFTLFPSADFYLIALPDQVLPHVTAEARFPEGAWVAHTSGTQPLEALQTLGHSRCGVFYPVQTFSREKDVAWEQIPICIEASSPEGQNGLTQLAQKLSRQVHVMPGASRRQLHLAAVFACNFTNHLWGVAQELLQGAELPVQLLAPLVQETLAKALEYPPFQVQTGPAQRNDYSTIQAHVELLATHPQYQHLYQTLTASIQATAGHGTQPFPVKEL